MNAAELALLEYPFIPINFSRHSNLIVVSLRHNAVPGLIPGLIYVAIYIVSLEANLSTFVVTYYTPVLMSSNGRLVEPSGD
jgi:hypothetical protein